MDKIIAKRYLFYGRVQGVGFRAITKWLARKYNIFGWVKNNDDGSVGLFVEGKEKDMNKFINHLKGFLKDNIEKIQEKREKEQGFKEFKIQL